jgi:hypothetical protein
MDIKRNYSLRNLKNIPSHTCGFSGISNGGEIFDFSGLLLVGLLSLNITTKRTKLEVCKVLKMESLLTNVFLDKK